MAHALRLDPRTNLGGQMPQPALSEDRLSHSSDGGFPGERDLVETSADLQTWTTDGVVNDDERWKKMDGGGHRDVPTRLPAPAGGSRMMPDGGSEILSQ
jgi:hypothetical protein